MAVSLSNNFSFYTAPRLSASIHKPSFKTLELKTLAFRPPHSKYHNSPYLLNKLPFTRASFYSTLSPITSNGRSFKSCVSAADESADEVISFPLFWNFCSWWINIYVCSSFFLFLIQSGKFITQLFLYIQYNFLNTNYKSTTTTNPPEGGLINGSTTTSMCVELVPGVIPMAYK